MRGAYVHNVRAWLTRFAGMRDVKAHPSNLWESCIETAEPRQGGFNRCKYDRRTNSNGGHAMNIVLVNPPHTAIGSRVPDVRSLPSSDGLAQLVIYLPGSHIWVHLSIDTRHRLRREVVVAPGHLIQHTFSYPHR